MKTQFIIPAMLVFGLTTAPLMANPTTISDVKFEILSAQEQEKTKIDPADLPVLVKEAIEKDEALKPLKISEAWQVTGENAPSHFVIKFDNGGEELVKKYTALGEVIED